MTITNKEIMNIKIMGKTIIQSIGFSILFVFLYAYILNKKLDINVLAATATVFLAFITFYYASITNSMLEEQQKSRKIEFIEKKFEKFYYPIKNALSSIVADEDYDEYQYRDEQADTLNKTLEEVQNYNYLASLELKVIIQRFPYIYHCWHKPSDLTMNEGDAWNELSTIIPRIHKLIDRDIKDYNKMLYDLTK